MEKKFIAACLSISLSVSIAACGSDAKTISASESISKSSQAASSKTSGTEAKTLTSGPVTLTYGNTGESLVEEYRSSLPDGIDFDTLSYERPDTEKTEKLISQIQSLMKDKKNADKVLSLFDDLLDLENEYWEAYELIEIASYKNVTDTSLSDELSTMDDLSVDLDDRIASLAKSILDSPCRDAARKAWSEDDVAYYESYTELTEEQKDLLTREQELISDYNEASIETYTVTIDGKEYTLEDLYYDDSIGNEDYQDYYQDIMQRENTALGSIYVDLIKVRNEIAESYGYDSYTDYAYESLYARDYTPEDADKLTDYFLKYLNGVYDELTLEYDEEAGSDLDEAFAEITTEQQRDLIRSYLAYIDPDLLESYLYMETNHLYDIDYSDTKMNTGFTIWLSSSSEPFLYNQQEYDFYDFTSLVHEFGHFNAYFVNADTANSAYNLDLAEIHSQGMELLFSELYPQIFDESHAAAAQDYILYQILGSVLDGCRYDRFQQEVYALEDPTLDEINTCFYQVSRSFGYDYGKAKTAYEWVEVPHNYTNPLYYISYAVSALPALELWEEAQTDYDKACSDYVTLVSYGEAGGYQDTLKASGLSDPFQKKTIKVMAETLEDYIYSR